MDTAIEKPNTETPAIVTENGAINSTIALNNSFADLISDDDMNHKDS